MNITFRQLRLVLALAETGSVSAAARRMHVTQPTASMQLKEVADNLGLPLFEIVARKVYMTEVGMELARTARARPATEMRKSGAPHPSVLVSVIFSPERFSSSSRHATCSG